MRSAIEYDSIKRILVTVITYCREVADHYDPINDESVTIFLKQHLSIRDWIVWRRIQVEQSTYRQATSSGERLSTQQVRQLSSQYKQAGYQLIQLWYREYRRTLQRLRPLRSIVKSLPTILDPIEHPDWVIQGWKIKFILSEKQLIQVREQSKLSNWYEDQVVRDTWIERVSTCLHSIQNFHKTFGTLPQVGDRLFDENTGTIIQDRSIDGHLMTVTFTLSS